jgi:hypothetical protein
MLSALGLLPDADDDLRKEVIVIVASMAAAGMIPKIIAGAQKMTRVPSAMAREMLVQTVTAFGIGLYLVVFAHVAAAHGEYPALCDLTLQSIGLGAFGSAVGILLLFHSRLRQGG